jgi:uncharacterized protein
MSSSTAEKVQAIFHHLSIQGQQSKFADFVADNVDWKIMGHSPMSRVYSGKQDFFDGTLKVLAERVLTEPLRLKVTNLIVSNDRGGDGEEINADAVVEMEAIDAKCRNGLSYTMKYCWVCGFEKGKIVRVRAYIDTGLLIQAMSENP